MSGTSLDGVTAAVVRFTEDEAGRVTPQLLARRTLGYAPAMRERLAAALVAASPAEYTRLDFDLGAVLADAAVAAIAEAGVARAHRLARPAARHLAVRPARDRKSTRLNSSHCTVSRMPSSA